MFCLGVTSFFFGLCVEFFKIVIRLSYSVFFPSKQVICIFGGGDIFLLFFVP